MLRFRLYFICLFLCFQGFATPALGADDAEKPETHASFVSQFLRAVKDKFSIGGTTDAEMNASRRNFLAGSGAAVLTAGVGGVGGLARVASGLGGLSEAWLQKIARIRTGAGLDVGGLENYIRVMEEELARVNNPIMEKALRARIAHARKTIGNLDVLKDRMSVADTRELWDPDNLSPHRLRRLRERLKASREKVLQNSQAESDLIQSILEAEALLTPLIRNRLNVQVRYTHPLRDEYVIALDDEDEQVVEEYLEMIWTIQEWMESYPDGASRKYIYGQWLKQRIEFMDHALRALRASQRHYSCEELTEEP